MNQAMNVSLIGGHEGLRLHAYPDSLGFLTVARGFNLDAAGARAVALAAGVDYDAVRAGAAITLAQADAIFRIQCVRVEAGARLLFPGYDTYPDNAAAVIADMIFELGMHGFEKFRLTIAALRLRDWTGAITAIMHSDLASEVPGRVENNLSLLRAIQASPDPGPVHQAGAQAV